MDISVLLIAAVLALAAVATTALRLRRRRPIGWRVGHIGRDRMYYEELIEGRWERIVISGEMLMGRAHHVIYFATEEEWEKYPAWARGRRTKIVARIKSAFAPPDYEYLG